MAKRKLKRPDGVPGKESNQEPKIFEPEILHWQEGLLGHYLKTYADVKTINPEQLSGEFYSETEIDIGKETLRRMFNRLSGKEEEFAQNNTSKDSYEKIALFLSHPKIGLLSLDHLKFRSFATTAPLSFINSLIFDLDDELPKLHLSYTGTYTSLDNSEETNDRQSLSIDLDDTKPWFTSRLMKYWTLGDNDKTKIFDGWGVVCPENNLFLHLKDADVGENLILTSPFCPLDFAAERSDNFKLVLGDSSNPQEVDDFSKSMESAKNWKSDQANNIHVFQWIKPGFLFDDRDFDMIDTGEGDVENIKQRQQKWNEGLKDNQFLKNSRFVSGKKLAQFEKDNKFDVSMQKKERYLGQRFIEAVQKFPFAEQEVSNELETGTDINSVNPFNGMTALHYAIAESNQKKVRWLIKQPGIDYTIKDKRGRTPAALASQIAVRQLSDSFFQSKPENRKRLSRMDSVARLLRIKEVQQIREMMENNDPNLPPAFQDRSIDNE